MNPPPTSEDTIDKGIYELILRLSGALERFEQSADYTDNEKARIINAVGYLLADKGAHDREIA